MQYIVRQNKDFFGGYSLVQKDWLNIKKEQCGPETFKREFLGEWVCQCSVQDNKGQHCPGKPEHYFEYKGKEVGLCDGCFQAYKHGAFDSTKRNYGKRLYIA